MHSTGGCDTCWGRGIPLAISKYSPHSGAAARQLWSSTIVRSLNLASPLFPCTSWGWVNIPGSAHCATERHVIRSLHRQLACALHTNYKKIFFSLTVVQTHFRGATTSVLIAFLRITRWESQPRASRLGNVLTVYALRWNGPDIKVWSDAGG